MSWESCSTRVSTQKKGWAFEMYIHCYCAIIGVSFPELKTIEALQWILLSKTNHMSHIPAPVLRAQLWNPARLGKERGGVRGRELERERGREGDRMTGRQGRKGGDWEADSGSQGTDSQGGGNARARAKRDIKSESDAWSVRDEERKRERGARIVWEEETAMRWKWKV